MYHTHHQDNILVTVTHWPSKYDKDNESEAAAYVIISNCLDQELWFPNWELYKLQGNK
jgi:hypothetical protein